MSLLGIDVGTSGCKAAAFSLDGKCYGVFKAEYGFIPAENGIFEVDAENVWDKIKNVIKKSAASVPAEDKITALSVSSMGEAVVPVSNDRTILSTSIISCDKRGGSYIEELKKFKSETELYKINPNILSPNYTLPKLLWLKDNESELFKKTDKFLFWADFVCFMLGAEAVTTNSLANRSLMFDLDENDWSEEILVWAGIEKEKFGRIVNGGIIIGSVDKDIGSELGLNSEVLIVSGGHDQCQNALGSGCIKPGTITCGLGTYECIAPVYSGIPDLRSMFDFSLGVEHHVLAGLYLSLIFNQAGMLINWFKNVFASDVNNNSEIFIKLNEEIPDEISELLAFPYFEATGSPYYINDCKGAFIGLTTKTTRGECFKAMLEGITFYFIESIENLKAVNVPFERVVASGGGAKSDKWLQLKADILNVPVMRPKFTECSILGAAMLAGIATGKFSAEIAEKIYIIEEKIFYPNKDKTIKYKKKYILYKKMFDAYYRVYKSEK